MAGYKAAFISVIIFFSLAAFGQAPVADFSVASPACLNQQIQAVNQSSNNVASEWDFCENDLALAPQFSSLGVISPSLSLLDLQVANDGTDWYGFVCDADANKIVRLNFGNSLSNVPSSAKISTISTPTGIEIVQIDGLWYGLVATFNLPSRVFLLSFGSLLSSDPTVVQINIPDNAIVSARSIQLVQDGSNFVAFVANWSQSQVTRINFGTTLSQNVISVDQVSVPGNNLFGLTLASDHSSKRAFVTSYSTNQIFKIDFGSSWMTSSPATGIVNDGGVFSSPSMVRSAFEGGHYYVLSANASGNIFRMDFGTDLSTLSPVITNLGTFGSMTNVRGMALVRNNHGFTAVLTSVSTNEVFTLNFKNASCAASFEFFDGNDPPPVSYSIAGSYPVTLRVKGNELLKDELTKTVVISSLPAPDLNIGITNKQCLNQPNEFTVTSSQVLTNFSWDFGEPAGVSSSASPTYTFSSNGKHVVSLNATSSNGCSNLAVDSIKVMSAPDFTLPAASPICTNQQYDFINGTQFASDFEPTWLWSMDAVTSTQRDFSSTLPSAGMQAISLTAMLDGCSNSISKNINSIVTGPSTDFSFSGICQNGLTQFTNQTTGAVTSYDWSFGDGNTATTTNPSNAYATTGSYTVTLTATNASGCNNSNTKTLTIFSNPQPDFSFPLPPFSCNGSSSQLTDQTPPPFDSNIVSWQWNFGDPSSSQNTSSAKNPIHIFVSAGTYTVTFTTTTNNNCSSTIQKSVTVLQAPVAAFTNNPPCKDQNTTFSDASTGNPVSWLWQIAGASSILKTQTHIFSLPGNYPVTLSVKGSNGCISSVSKTISVPVAQSPDFTVYRNCVAQQTGFKDSTASSSDPIQSYSWDFETLGTGTGSRTTFSFPTIGSYNVTLKVTAQSGCSYSTTKIVDIGAAPVAAFTASPMSGIPPLDVHFTNTSTLATSYRWTFNDTPVTTSTETSPSHTFTKFGDYVVDLQARNAIECTTTISKIVSVLIPVNDIAIVGFLTTQNADGSLNAVATIKNNSNVSASNADIIMDISGNATIRDHINATLLPGQVYNYLFSYQLTNVSQLAYLCAEVAIDNDVNEANNRSCIPVNKTTFVYNVYPNPANDRVHVDLIATASETVSVLLVDELAKESFRDEFTIDAGFNQYMIPASNLSPGIYVMTIQSSSGKKVFKISIVR